MDYEQVGDEQREEDFAALLEQFDYVQPRRADIREGVVLAKSLNQIMLDVGLKRDAIVTAGDIQKMDPAKYAAIQVGDTVNAYVVHPNDRDGNLIVSIRLAREYEDWLKVEEMLETGELFEATVADFNKGGLLCQYGFLQGFIPASQIANSALIDQASDRQEGLAGFIGQTMVLKVIEVNRQRRRLIVSQRAAQREWRAKQRDQLFAELVEGEIREGVVSSIRNFGAFVDLGGVDGLVHLSELSWARVRHPGEVVRVGQRIRVMVLNIDLDDQRIGLSIKRTLADPWDLVDTKYAPGQIVSGTVAHLAKFGAFVELEPGVEGLIHISELANGNIMDPADVVTEGQVLQLVVLTIEPDRHRIGLSLRHAQVDEAPFPELGEADQADEEGERFTSEPALESESEDLTDESDETVDDDA